MTDFKQLRDVEVKDASTGEVQAVFSTFDVIDADRDVTRPGAFQDGAAVRISAYGHESWKGALPIGRGTITSNEKEAILNGRFFMDTTAGRDTFTVVKEMGELQEWSYSVEPLKVSFGEFEGQQVRFLESIKVDEVSPVLVGAGVNTRTLSTKDHPDKFLDHASSVIAEVRALLKRTEDVIASRVEQGKSPMADRSVELLSMLDEDLVRLKSILEPAPEPLPTELEDLAWREYSRFLELQRIINT